MRDEKGNKGNKGVSSQYGRTLGGGKTSFSEGRRVGFLDRYIDAYSSFLYFISPITNFSVLLLNRFPTFSSPI
jgi:hypothetical protein